MRIGRVRHRARPLTGVTVCVSQAYQRRSPVDRVARRLVRSPLITRQLFLGVRRQPPRLTLTHGDPFREVSCKRQGVVGTPTPRKQLSL
jgi:hypothetical protein